MSKRFQNINLKNATIQGVGQEAITENVPRFNRTETELLYEGKNNASIVIGKDRPGDIFSGFGGAGQKRCGSIDLVAGRISSMPIESKNGENVVADNNIFLDASRITISQRTNVDENHFITSGKIGNRNNTAAIVIKSDNLRFISREGIKLVTGTDKYDSNGKLIAKMYGIDLIAGNNDKELQPIPKGENLKEFLSDSVMQTIARHGSEMATIYKILIQICGVLAGHVHTTAVGPTSPSVELIAVMSSAIGEASLHAQNLQTEQINLTSDKINYLSVFGKKYINSRFNNTN